MFLKLRIETFDFGRELAKDAKQKTIRVVSLVVPVLLLTTLCSAAPIFTTSSDTTLQSGAFAVLNRSGLNDLLSRLHDSGWVPSETPRRGGRTSHDPHFQALLEHLRNHLGRARFTNINGDLQNLLHRVARHLRNNGHLKDKPTPSVPAPGAILLASSGILVVRLLRSRQIVHY